MFRTSRVIFVNQRGSLVNSVFVNLLGKTQNKITWVKVQNFQNPELLKLQHTRIQDFCQGGSRPDGQKTVWTMFFFFFVFFFSPQPILQFTEGVKWFYYRENYTFPRIQRGSNIFQGGGGGGSNFFQGDPNANFYRNPYYL